MNFPKSDAYHTTLRACRDPAGSLIAQEEIMKVTGRCHCGQISFEAEIDPAQVRVCHCTDCSI
jgi:hypothetical protein